MSINDLEAKISQAHANNSETASLLATLCAKLGLDPGPDADAKEKPGALAGSAVINEFIYSLSNLSVEQAKNNALISRIIGALFDKVDGVEPSADYNKTSRVDNARL